MRFVVFGAGAIGGVVGACLHQSGHDVALIARGEHGRAIRERGLTFERPGSSITLEIPVAPSPAELEWGGDDIVLLATKSQDTSGALTDLRGAAPIGTPVVCVQNAVENERIALRLFPRVYGAFAATSGSLRASSRISARTSANRSSVSLVSVSVGSTISASSTISGKYTVGGWTP